MALKYLTSLDVQGDLTLNGNELQNFALQTLAADPTGYAGRVYFNTATKRAKISDGAVWTDLGITYTASEGILISEEDIQIADLGVTNAKLAANAVSTAKINDGAVTTAKVANNAITGEKLDVVDNGTAGQVLATDGDGSFTWVNNPDEDVDVVNLTARLSEIATDITIGNGASATVTIAGNLKVNGETTIVNTETINLADNIITLNSNALDESEDAGIEVYRGEGSPAVSVRWNATRNSWEFTNNGTTYDPIPTPDLYTANTGTIEGVTAGAGLTGGGTSGTVTLDVGAGTGISVAANAVSLNHLGLEDLADPTADRILFWDNSAGALKWLSAGTNITISGTSISAQSPWVNGEWPILEYPGGTPFRVTIGDLGVQESGLIMQVYEIVGATFNLVLTSISITDGQISIDLPAGDFMLRFSGIAG
jgi:hypothetical protein